MFTFAETSGTRPYFVEGVSPAGIADEAGAQKPFSPQGEIK
jgi:hypothetical protein